MKYTFKTMDGRKPRVCTIEMKWDGTRFSASGVIATKGGRYVEFGQCLDNKLFQRNDISRRLVRVWKEWHLNDMTAGTPSQMKCIKEHQDEIREEDGWYTKECNLLQKYNLLEDNGYKYGTGWLLREIPEDVKAEINDLVAYFN